MRRFFLKEASGGSLRESNYPPCRDAVRFTTYASMLRRCAAEKYVQETKAVHAHMYRAGFPYLALGNKLIDAYLKSGSFYYARKVFDEMPARHIVSWNSMISSYVRRGMVPEAIVLYRRMPAEGVSPDGFTFASVLTALTELGSLSIGRQTHAHLLVSGGLGGAANPLFVTTALVNLYAKLGSPKEARLVYDLSPEKDVVLGTALIVGCSQAGEDAEAARAFADMVNGGIAPNEFTFASVLVACGNLADISLGGTIHGLATKAGFDRGVSSQTSLLVMYCKCSLIDAALRVYSSFAAPDLNLVARTAAMGVFLASHREEEALSAFKSLLRDSSSGKCCRPNAFALSTALRACASLALLRAGEQIHALAFKIGLSDADRFVVASLIDVYGKCGKVDLARALFEGLEDNDVVAVNSMIGGYAANGLGVEAMKLFHEATSSGLRPSNATFTSALAACGAAGMVEEGRRIFAAIGEPTREHVSCFVDVLARGGRLAEAERLLVESRVVNPDAVLWRTLLGACKLHGEVEMAERAARRVLELSPGDEGTVVLLSNVYAAAGRWAEVAQTKRAARGMGLKKEPAVSWVEAGKRVHCFVAGDRSHPRAAEIYETLEALIERTRRLGYVPDKRFVLDKLDEESSFDGERSLYYHSEKLAVAFAVMSGGEGTITVMKNLRVCGDCHAWLKLATVVLGRGISARDARRYHHFSDGLCSCGDYW